MQKKQQPTEMMGNQSLDGTAKGSYDYQISPRTRRRRMRIGELFKIGESFRTSGLVRLLYENNADTILY
jgi:hypothetical protein